MSSATMRALKTVCFAAAVFLYAPTSSAFDLGGSGFIARDVGQHVGDIRQPGVDDGAAAGFISGALVLLDAANVDGTDNSSMTDLDQVGHVTAGALWANLGSLGGTFGGTSGKVPLWIEDGVSSGVPTVRFDKTNVDELVSSLASSNYQFLHDGSDFTIYLVMKPTTNTGTTILVNTTIGAGSGTGIHLRQLATSKMSGYTYNTAVSEVHSINGADDTFDDDAYNFVIYECDATVWTFYNGVATTIATDTQNNTPDAATDPDSSLRLSGDSGGGAFQFNGDIVHFSVYDGVHTTTQKNAQAAAINTKFGLSL